ncbi:MAG: hypothetical protein IJ796_09190 [Lachnospiraceae bacterium]|nr:hypothetical protein [Lachnospiraceae bacterium]
MNKKEQIQESYANFMKCTAGRSSAGSELYLADSDLWITVEVSDHGKADSESGGEA